MEIKYEVRHYIPPSEDEFKEIKDLLIRNSREFLPPLLGRPGFSSTIKVLKERGNIFYILKTREKRTLAAITCIETNSGGPYVPFLIVDPEFRRKGWSKTLMDYLTKDLEKKGYSHLNLETWSTNGAALNLFKSYGFKVIKIVKDGRGEGVDDLKLGLSLHRKLQRDIR